MKFKSINRTRLRIARDRLLPDRPVRRQVRGVEMLLPRRHVLPYLAADDRPYAHNLVDLAVRLGAAAEEELVVLDVGANVGDSTLLIRDRVACRTVCVEGDPQWLRYLEQNVGHLTDVSIEPSLLAGDGEVGFASIVHEDAGSSHLVPADEGTGTPMLPAGELLARHPELARVRLVKSDTDGYDVTLVPALARTFAASKPVLFFEYDPVPTRIATPGVEPARVWAELAEQGYDRAAVWTNGGRVLGNATVADLATRCEVLDADRGDRGYEFWDVAVAHRDDADGATALAGLVAAGTPHPAAWVQVS